MSYHLEYVDKPGKFDEIIEQDGIKVLIDSKALFSIIGSEMDWAEDKLRYVTAICPILRRVRLGPDELPMLLVLSLNLRTLISKTLAAAVNHSWCRSCKSALAPVLNIIPPNIIPPPTSDTTPKPRWKLRGRMPIN